MTLSRLATSALYERYTPAGIAGYGGWASVTAATGTYTTGTYNDGTVDWVYYQWTGNGSVTLTAGVVDVFMISQGGSYFSSQQGAGGRVRDGVHAFSAGTHSVVVGSSALFGAYGGWSGIGSLKTAPSPIAYGGNLPGASTNDATAGTGLRLGIESSITGSTVEYGRDGRVGTPRANRGDGASTTGDGSSGVVIIRVPVNPELWGAPPTQGVLPNLGVGWASVTAASGTFTKGSYTDADGQWTYWKFTASSSSITTTAGLVDALLVGGGGGAGPNGTSSGGRINYGLLQMPASAHTVTVGAGGTNANYASGRWSGLGSHIVGDIKGLNGSGSGEVNGGGSTNFGIASSITGTSVNYGVKDATGNLVANTGSTSVNLNNPGTAGVVIVRVPTAFDLT